jgi:hypothetical protein
MRKVMRLVGWVTLVAGLIAIAGSAVLTLQGFNATVNFGDPAEYQFYLVPVWQLGAVVALLGFAILMVLSAGRTAP